MTHPLKALRRLLPHRLSLPARPGHRLNRRFPQLRRNIFIVTYGRSGSTLLQSLLNTIPGCQIRGENHNTFESVWASCLRARKTKAGWGSRPRPQNHPWYGSESVRPDRFTEGLIDAFVDNVLMPDPRARYFGFKEIRYDAFGNRLPELLDFMQAQFKDPLFVFNTRSVEDVMQSSWWKKWDPEDVRKLVSRMDRRFADYQAAHPERAIITRYEDFSTDPEALRPIFEILGEPFDAARLAPVLDERLTH